MTRHIFNYLKCTIVLFALVHSANSQCPDLSANDEIQLNSQQEVNNFPNDYNGCQVFENNINISGSDIIDLTPLQQIVSIENAGLIINGNAQLSSLNGLENLTDTAFLQISFNPQLLNLDGLIGLSNLPGREQGNSQFPGGLIIRGNENLININGLQNLSTIADTNLENFSFDSIRIDNNDSLLDLSGLEQLIELPGDLVISDNDALMTLTGLDNLETVKSLDIDTNSSLINLDALDNLSDDVSGGIFITGNDSIENIDGLSQITSCFNLHILANESLLNLDGLLGINFINQFSAVWIAENDSLTSVSGLSNIDTIALNSGNQQEYRL